MSMLILLVIIVAVILFLVGIYNGLVTARNGYKNAFAQIDVQLQRRYDLIPNLVETAKGYLKHERETLEAVIAARNSAVGAARAAAERPGEPGAMKALASAEGALSAGLGRLMVLSETYPDLKANTTMRELSEELTSTENKVAFSRQAFNDSVTEYNTAKQTFPAVLFAAAMGFVDAALLEVIESAEERKAPKVSFS